MFDRVSGKRADFFIKASLIIQTVSNHGVKTIVSLSLKFTHHTNFVYKNIHENVIDNLSRCCLLDVGLRLLFVNYISS